MSVLVEQAATWRRAVEAAVEHLADDYEIDPVEVLAQEAFIARLDATVDLDPDADAEAFAEAVEVALAEHTAPTHAWEAADVDERTTEATDHIEGHVTEALGTDAVGGRVFRVRIIREGTSRNRKRYTEAVLRRAAPLYNGAKCYDHHRTPQEMQTSTLQGLVGGYRNVAYEGDGLYGDLHLFPSAVQTAEALSAAIDAQAAGLPPLVGISHDVLASFKAGTPTSGGHVQEAVAITRVHSADVVADPSAGGQATRVLAGGIESEEAAVPLTAEELAAIGTAAAAALLDRQQTVTESTGPERVTESGTPKTDFAAQVIIREKLAEAGMSALRESVTARLPERITEADIDNEIAAYKAMLADVEKAGLAPTVTTQVVKESRDKKVAALDAFFAQNWTEGYHSFRQAFLDITGYQPRSWGEDVNRLILRESFGSGFDSGVRATESMDSSTWAQVLGDSVTRRVVAAYRNPMLSSWRKIVSSTAPISDFRTQRVGRTGGYGTLPTVAEGGPYQPLTSPGDEEATGALSKKGGTEDVTLEMVANDDRRAISQIPSKLGRAAAQTLYRDVFDTLVDNDTCTYDSVALFHTSHANTDTSAGLAQSTLTTGRRKMIEQAAYGDSSEILALTPKYLIVPPELEETAFVLAGSRAVPASNTVGASDQPNIHAGIEPILVPYLTDANDWYLVADPDSVPTLEVGFYNGRQEPELFTQSDNSVGSVFNSDTFTWKIRFIYLVMILDHRGFYRGQG
jgi:hypothetical protein